MSTINSYVLKQMPMPLVITVVVAPLFLLTGRMLRLRDLVLSSSGLLRPLLRILTVLIPHYVTLALPIALFLGILLPFIMRIEDVGRRIWSNFRLAGQEGR
jgi:lipopolysaccharide export system permease protein